MNSTKEKSNKKILLTICLSILFIIVSLFVYTGRNHGSQAMNAMYLSAQFSGEVKIADGDWKPYVKGEHIPSDEGNVTLKGQIELVVPHTGEVIGKAEQGILIAFYFDHIGGKISENGREFHTFDAESDVGGDELCGIVYSGYEIKGGDEITIELTNPHNFGNHGAIDDFLNNLSIYGGTDFERDELNRGNTQRVLGIFLIMSAFMILGTAMFFVLVHIRGIKNLWLIGFSVFFAGVYFIFNANGIMFFSEVIKFNTRVLGASMMLYMLSVTAFLTLQLQGKSQKLAGAMVYTAAFTNVIIFISSISPDVNFYDALSLWALIQGIICLMMIVIFVHRILAGEKNERAFCAMGILPMAAFVVDILREIFGCSYDVMASQIVFALVFLVAIFLLLKVIPKNMNATIRAKELEAEKQALKAELAESRIATMISQIQPHFIYNTLGTIEQLCMSEPETASKLVRNFSLYLRGNFSELDTTRPIRFSKEMEHVRHYTDIEQVRFPDMTIKYDLRSVEFLLPALSVQPLVENAIKHGLMGLEEGGAVKIASYETDTHYVVEVTDDGVGFDAEAGYDESKHLGIKNIRGRLEAMCGGTLLVESKKGEGTKASIKMPKEAMEYDSDNG